MQDFAKNECILQGAEPSLRDPWKMSPSTGMEFDWSVATIWAFRGESFHLARLKEQLKALVYK